jgi:hypothetical protein
VATPKASAAASSGSQSSESGASQPVALQPSGTYTYHLSGSSSSALGDQPVDGNSTLTVDPPQGQRQHSTQRDDQGSTEQTVVAQVDGLHLADIHLSQSGFDEDFRADKPVLLGPAHPSNGQSWKWHLVSTDGKYTLHAHLTVADTHSSAKTSSGAREHTVEIKSVLVLDSKDIHLTIHQDDQATGDAVIVREHAVSDGTAYGTKFHSDVTRTLASRPNR